MKKSAHCKAPTPYNGIALGMVGPTLIEVGTEAQKQRYLAKMLTCEEIWCQGYSGTWVWVGPGLITNACRPGRRRVRH